MGEITKIEKPLIRIIEFEEFEALLAACAPPEVKGFDADRNGEKVVDLWGGIRNCEIPISERVASGSEV